MTPATTPATPTRERLIEAGAGLFQRRGYVGTGVKQIVAEAGAPFSSLYHFFPGGKEELGAEIIRWSGALYGQLVGVIFDPAPDVVTAVQWFFAGAAQTLIGSGYADACPIATVALEVASTSEILRIATDDVFTSWLVIVAERFEGAGIEPATARELAMATVALLEGAFVLSRAARSVEPMHVCGAACATLVRAALPAEV